MGVLYDHFQLAPDEFRLLRLRSISEEGILCCSLGKHDVFTKDLSYLAVSYTTGSQPFAHCIECNEIDMKVTKSCYDVLLAIEKDFIYQHHIWIDQVTILDLEMQSYTLSRPSSTLTRGIWMKEVHKFFL